MNRTVIVAGISGTGKTTVCSHVEKIENDVGEKVNVTSLGTVMVEFLEKNGKSMSSGAPVKIVVNAEGKQEAAKEILTALEVL